MSKSRVAPFLQSWTRGPNLKQSGASRICTRAYVVGPKICERITLLYFASWGILLSQTRSAKAAGAFRAVARTAGYF